MIFHCKGSASALQLTSQYKYARETTLPSVKCSGADQFSYLFNSDNSQATVRKAESKSNWNYGENFRSTQWDKLALAQECELSVWNKWLYTLIIYCTWKSFFFGTMKTGHLFWFCPALLFRAVTIPELKWVPQVRTITWCTPLQQCELGNSHPGAFCPLRNTNGSRIHPRLMEETGRISSACGVLESQSRAVKIICFFAAAQKAQY